MTDFPKKPCLEKIHTLFLSRENSEKEDAQTYALHKGCCLAKKRTDCFCYRYNVLFPKR